MFFSHMNDAHCTLIRFDLPILQYVILIMARSCFARIVNRDHSSSFLKGTQQKMRERKKNNGLIVHIHRFFLGMESSGIQSNWYECIFKPVIVLFAFLLILWIYRFLARRWAHFFGAKMKKKKKKIQTHTKWNNAQREWPHVYVQVSISVWHWSIQAAVCPHHLIAQLSAAAQKFCGFPDKCMLFKCSEMTVRHGSVFQHENCIWLLAYNYYKVSDCKCLSYTKLFSFLSD